MILATLVLFILHFADGSATAAISLLTKRIDSVFVSVPPQLTA
jgi:hypothetical protein